MGAARPFINLMKSSGWIMLLPQPAADPGPENINQKQGKPDRQDADINKYIPPEPFREQAN
jgi:hypothetical protein